MDIKHIIGDYQLFVRVLLANQSAIGINTDGYEFDHLCYRVSTLDEYDDVKTKLTPLSSELAITFHNGREFVIFKLALPLVVGNLQIPLIELPTPAPDKPYTTGLEHAEVVMPRGFKEFCELHKGILTKQPDMTSINPAAVLTFADKTTIKFHPLSLADAVVLQGGRFEPVNMMHNPDNLREIDRIIASVVVISADGKILMGRKDPSKGGVYPDAWHIPGGGIDAGESLEDAAKREVLEEVGIDLTNETIKLIPSTGRGESPKTLSSGERVWCNMTFNRFEARLSQPAENIDIKPNDDLVELRWFDEVELREVELVPGGREFFIEAGYIKII